MDGQEILHGLNLEIKAGEIHAIMGPNGGGKSTLAKALMGHPMAKVTAGSVLFEGKDLLAMTPNQRAATGVFLSFQYPKGIPGVSMSSFLRSAYNSIQKSKDPAFKPVSLPQFKKQLKELMDKVHLPAKFLTRSVNEGFSGGEAKKSEILQLGLLEPKLAILDETDSGLDLDALKAVCQAILTFKSPSQSILMITHYQRMLHYIKPDIVHILLEGRILKSGGMELVEALEKSGYEPFRQEAGLSASPFNIL